ncbi:MAG: hypothetical protein OD918_01435 [Gammaproteobacteria bacterium]
MDINYPFFLLLFFVVTVMFTVLYLKREDRETPFIDKARWFFGMKPRDR